MKRKMEEEELILLEYKIIRNDIDLYLRDISDSLATHIIEEKKKPYTN